MFPSITFPQIQQFLISETKHIKRIHNVWVHPLQYWINRLVCTNISSSKCSIKTNSNDSNTINIFWAPISSALWYSLPILLRTFWIEGFKESICDTYLKYDPPTVYIPKNGNVYWVFIAYPWIVLAPFVLHVHTGPTYFARRRIEMELIRKHNSKNIYAITHIYRWNGNSLVLDLWMLLRYVLVVLNYFKRIYFSTKWSCIHCLEFIISEGVVCPLLGLYFSLVKVYNKIFR
jgi:hypothetical protein